MIAVETYKELKDEKSNGKSISYYYSFLCLLSHYSCCNSNDDRVSKSHCFI